MKTVAYTLILAGLLSMTGCHSRHAACRDGSCGLLGGGCASGACGTAGAVAGGPGAVAGGQGQAAYAPNHGHGGPLGAPHAGRHHRGPQSHQGPTGPVAGPASPTVTYPYYTTRGPRDFLAKDPPSIGR